MVHIFEGMEWRKTAVWSLCQILCCPTPSGNRVLSVHFAVLCVPALSAQLWPLQPDIFIFFSLSFSACAINFSLSISFDGLDLETTVAVSTDQFIQKLSIFPHQNVLFADSIL